MIKFKVGDIAFFKKAKATSKNKAPEVGFKGGHGFGIMLGIVPSFCADPKEEHLMILMGQAGFISFDDVANFLGDEMGKQCVKKFEAKYYAPVLEKQKIIVPTEKEKPKLILSNDEATP